MRIRFRYFSVFIPIIAALMLHGCRKSSATDQTAPQQGEDLQTSAQPNSKPASRTNRSSSIAQDEILRPLFSSARSRPSLDVLQMLRPEHRTELTDYYRSHHSPLERHAITWALGFVGDDESVALLINALTNDYREKKLIGSSGGIGGNEESAVQNTIYALGFLGARYDSAFKFLTNATTARFWATNGAWLSERGTDEFGILAGRAIVAIGMTGRREVPDILAAMKEQPLKNDLDASSLARTLEGPVVDAAFYYSMIRDRGLDAFLHRFFGSGEPFDADGSFRKWQGTEEGKSWMEWYKSRQ